MDGKTFFFGLYRSIEPLFFGSHRIYGEKQDFVDVKTFIFWSSPKFSGFAIKSFLLFGNPMTYSYKSYGVT